MSEVTLPDDSLAVPNDQVPKPKRSRSEISILGLLQVIGFLPFIATFLGLAGRLHWMLDLFNHFRFQYLIVLSVVGGLLFFMKCRKFAGIYLVGVMVNLVLIFPMYWPIFNFHDSEKPILKIMHFNVFTGNQNYDEIAQYIADMQCDIVLIQELHLRMDERLRKMDDYQMIDSVPRYDSFGIGMLVANKTLEHLHVEKISITDITDNQAKVPVILADLIWHDQPIALMSLHTLPPRSKSYSMTRDLQLLAAAKWINEQVNPVILMGDLNATPWSVGFRPLFWQTILTNSQRGFGVQGSWPADGGPIGKIPIDHCLISPQLSIVDRHLGENHGSDHLPLFVSIQLK